jgi:hypothetical protein
MNYKVYNSPFPYIVITDYFSTEELSNIWNELEYMTHNDLMLPPEKSESATENGMLLKNNKALFLDTLYRDRNNSSILKFSRKIYNDQEFKTDLIKQNWFFEYLQSSNQDSTLVSYYENSSYYKPHKDASMITAVTHLFKEPIKFSGGCLCFDDYNLTFENENNRMIMFPSVIRHSVKEIKLDGDVGNCNGRYTISQFIGLSIY